MNFVPVKKTRKNSKNSKSAREKKVGLNNLKNGPKSGRENEKMPVKKPKKSPKIAFTGTFFFSRGKKKKRHNMHVVNGKSD